MKLVLRSHVNMPFKFFSNHEYGRMNWKIHSYDNRFPRCFPDDLICDVSPPTPTSNQPPPPDRSGQQCDATTWKLLILTNAEPILCVHNITRTKSTPRPDLRTILPKNERRRNAQHNRNTSQKRSFPSIP